LKKTLKKILSQKLPPSELRKVSNSYDIIGDIAIIRSTGNLQTNQIAGNAIRSIHRNVHIVFIQSTPIHGDYRLRKLELVVGENRAETIYKEFGCSFLVDVTRCYFSPRLSFERMRIAKQVAPDEVLINMFAGVGCFSVIISKYSNAKRIYSIDLNPQAYCYMKKNIQLNNLVNKVLPIIGDAQDVLSQKRFLGSANRVLMPLPELASTCLPVALSVIKPGGLIHYYDFTYSKKSESPVAKITAKDCQQLDSLGAVYNVRFGKVVRSVGPNWYQIALDINVV
jgi:tRNA (guanine37-N1)-methyltransferase